MDLMKNDKNKRDRTHVSVIVSVVRIRWTFFAIPFETRVAAACIRLAEGAARSTCHSESHDDLVESKSSS